MLVNYGRCAIFFGLGEKPLVKGDWKYTKINDTDITLKKYIGTETNITVPTEL